MPKDDANDTPHPKLPPLEFAGSYPFKSVLLSDKEREAIIQQHGVVVAGIVDQVVATRGQQVMEGFARTMRTVAKALAPEDTGPQLLSHSEAATMLGVSLATVKRMVTERKLPRPVRVSDHRIGHRLEDLKAFVAGTLVVDPKTGKVVRQR